MSILNDTSNAQAFCVYRNCSRLEFSTKVYLNENANNSNYIVESWNIL